MESHDLPGRGSAKCRMVSGAALVLFAPSSVQMILLHDGSVSTPSPCSQHSITARRRLSSDWCCLCIPSNTSLGINLSPSVLQATPGRYFRTPSAVRGGTEEKKREEGGRQGRGSIVHLHPNCVQLPCQQLIRPDQMFLNKKEFGNVIHSIVNHSWNKCEWPVHGKSQPHWIFSPRSQAFPRFSFLIAYSVTYIITYSSVHDQKLDSEKAL